MRGYEEELVISGVSGRFPLSRSVNEFAENLLNGVDMVTEDDKRWPPGLFGLPRRHGKLDDIDKFDAQFFGVSGIQANMMDPQLRLLHEVVYEAICDAGVIPATIRGRSIGVFVTSTISEAKDALCETIDPEAKYSLLGTASAMLANRISYSLDLRGPSFVIDTACASSLSAIEQAIRAMRHGQCEAAIVGGVHMTLSPVIAQKFNLLSMLSSDGKSKVFDATADGYARTEACSAIFIQKIGDAKRIYAKIININSNVDGYKKEGTSFPSYEMQRRLLHDTYEQCNLSPLAVNYVEAHGTGTKVGDPVEGHAISSVFCPGRNSPLLVGSTKSNMGHAEFASGLCSLVKIFIAFEKGIIPANLHLKTINPAIESLVNGSIKPVTQNTKFDGGLVGINSFGFGGANVHLIVQSHDGKRKSDSNDVVPDTHPRLVTVCGRNEEAVTANLNFIRDNPSEVTREFLALMNDLSKTEPEGGMKSRGFILLNSSTAQTNVNRIDEKRPLWFIMPGMGCQWTAMGRQLMRLPHFAQSINEFARILKEKNIDLIHLLTSDDKQLLNHLVNRFVMISSVQGALIDLLYSLGVVADGFVGHSQGELACAYADGCLNKRQFILASYWRMKCCEQLNLSGGLMAAVRLTVDECEKRMPKDVSIACFNSHQSLTISGPEESVRSFVKELSSEDIFAREVSSCGVALHTSHVSNAAGSLLKELKKEITSPVKRSPKWISSSVPESKWTDTESQYASAQYFTNNLVSQVLFADAVKHIPKNAILLEVSAHPLFKAALHQCLGSDATHICLMNKNSSDQMSHLFTGLGQLYNAGVNLNLEVVYPAVQYPVPRGTPSISSLMRWDHAQSWLVPKYPEYFNPSKATSDIKTTIDLSTVGDAYIADHVIDGRVLFPATGYVMLAWQAFAQVHNQVWTDCPVNISNIRLHRASVLPKSGPVVFSTQVLLSTGEFRITEGGALVASGQITWLSPDDTDLREMPVLSHDEGTLLLKKDDFYKELRVRGYDFGPTFQCIQQATFDVSSVVVKWPGKWVPFADALIQLPIWSLKDRDLNLPTGMVSIKCDPTVLLSLQPGSLLNIHLDHECLEITSLGLKIKMPSGGPAPRKKVQVSHESYTFVPHFEDNVECEDVREYISLCSYVASAILKKAKRDCEANSLNVNSKTSLESIEDIYRSVHDDKDLILLKCLCELIIVNDIDEKNLEVNVASVLTKYHDELKTDLLQHSFTSGRVLRPMIDLVIENTASQVLQVLEVESFGNPFAGFVENFAHLKNRSVNHSLLGNGEGDSSVPGALSWKKGKSLDLPPQDLIIYHQSPETAKDAQIDELFTHICSLVAEGGFLLLGGRTVVTQVEKIIFNYMDSESLFDRLIAQAETVNFSVVARKTNCTGGSLVLLRKKKEQATYQGDISIIGVNSTEFTWVEELKAAMADCEAHPEKGDIWIMNTDGACSGLLGLVNCLRLEPGGNKIRCIFDKARRSIDEVKSYVIDQKILNSDLAVNVIDNNNHLGSYYHLDCTSMNKMVACEHAFLHPITKGDVSSLTWIESKCKLFRSDEAHRSSQLTHIYYSSLNFRDLMLATGKLELSTTSSNSNIGMEIAGRKSTGERVMGFVSEEGIATTCVVDDTLIWRVPDTWSLEEAATVPVAYCTAYYALIVRGSLQPGESVLIHSGAGALGLAAISVCLSMKCQVLVTVGTPAKIKYLLEEFPQLKEEHFFNSRDLTFENGIMKATNGRGVDVVLNSLAGEKLKASARVLARYGRFLEVGKYDMMKDSSLGMSMFMPNICFHGVCLAQIFSSDPSESCEEQKKMVKRLMEEGIANGTVRPLRRTVFSRDEAENAFRYMMKGEHIGKILIQMRQEEGDKLHRPEPVKMLAIARTFFHSNKSYIIIGGLGGFGLELAYWMVTRGAMNLILTSRSGVKDSHQTYCLNRLEKMGATVIVSKLDAGDSLGTTKLLDEAIALGPVGGIFNLALVLRDKLLVNQTEESFREVTHCKVTATINLDTASRVKCPQLDHFVVFSSIACGYGNAGQSNYGLANSVMERICEERRKLNLPAIAIQWGAIADVGVIADKISSDTEIAGTVPQRINSCLSALDRMLVSQETIVTSVVRSSRAKNSIGTSGASGDELISMICHILGVGDPSSVSPTTTLQQLGMDSLMSIDIKQTLERECNSTMTLTEVHSLTFAQLRSMACAKDPVDGNCHSEATSKLVEPTESINSFSLERNINSSLLANDGEGVTDKRFDCLPSRRPVANMPCEQIADHLDRGPETNVQHQIRESPISVLLDNEAGARALFSLLSLICVTIVMIEESRCYYNDEERVRRNNFWTGQFSSWPFFLTTWLWMHVVVCAGVYPVGRLMREGSNKLCTISALTFIILIKYIVFQSYRKFTLRGDVPSVTLTFTIAIELIRLLMKSISYLAECRSNEVRSKATLSSFIYFLLAPTLIYRSEYSRKAGAINWRQAFKYFLGSFLLTYMLALWFKNFFEPMNEMINVSHKNSSPLLPSQLIHLFVISGLTALFFWLWVGFAVFHFYFNATAELLRHCDRQFYKYWWNATSEAELLRAWNHLTHQWIERYFFMNLIDKFGKLTTIAVVFIITGIAHDLVAAFIFGFFIPAYTFSTAVAGCCVLLEKQRRWLESKFPDFFNYLHISCYGTFFFTGPSFALYVLETQSRTLCPHLYESAVSDVFTIRFNQCFNFK